MASDGNNANECPPAEDDGLVDLQEKYRKSCRATAACAQLFEQLTKCNQRVNSRSKTAETCMEEMIDYVHCVDHCAAKKFFPLLK